MILEALKGLAAIPEIVAQLQAIGSKLDDKAAMERLADKRIDIDERINAVKRVPVTAPDGGADVDGPAPGGTESGG